MLLTSDIIEPFKQKSVLWHMRPAQTQIRLLIPEVWSESTIDAYI